MGVFFMVCRGFGVFQACVGGYFFFIFLIEIGVPLSEWQILGGPGSFGDCCFRSDHIW